MAADVPRRTGDKSSATFERWRTSARKRAAQTGVRIARMFRAHPTVLPGELKAEVPVRGRVMEVVRVTEVIGRAASVTVAKPQILALR
jgi:hypothetical protein